MPIYGLTQSLNFEFVISFWVDCSSVDDTAFPSAVWDLNIAKRLWKFAHRLRLAVWQKKVKCVQRYSLPIFKRQYSIQGQCFRYNYGTYKFRMFVHSTVQVCPLHQALQGPWLENNYGLADVCGAYTCCSTPGTCISDWKHICSTSVRGVRGLPCSP